MAGKDLGRALRTWEPGVVLRALLRGGERREAGVAMVLRPDNLFQPYTTTAANRYPEEFAAIRAALSVAAPTILSFGCSSGDELVSLAAEFATARIHGVDINPLAVRHARQRIKREGLGSRVTVARGSDASTEAPASYDVVTALAVFRHGALKAEPETCTAYLRFADFERTATGLADVLRPRGLLLVRHANFRFADCAVAAGFEPVWVGQLSGLPGETTPVYGPDDRLVPGAVGDGLYRKLGAAE